MSDRRKSVEEIITSAQLETRMAVGLGSSAQYVDIQLARNEISGMSSLVTITERLVEQLNEQKNPSCRF